MRLRIVRELMRDRDQAMARARHCRERGLLGVDIDVRIARVANRLAIRTLKRGA